MKTTLFNLSVAMCSCYLSCTSVASGSEAEHLQAITDDWLHRRQIHSAKYHFEGNMVTPKGFIVGAAEADERHTTMIPANDYVFPASVDIWFDLSRRWIRVDERRKAFDVQAGQFFPRRTVGVYDGQKFAEHLPRHDNGVLQQERAKFSWESRLDADESCVMNSCVSAVMLAHGIIPNADGFFRGPMISETR